MAQVVFTSIAKIEDFETATWLKGDNESYDRTKKMVGETDGIKLIGRQDKYGRVDVSYASANSKEWTVVSGRHVTLARFFAAKLAECPAGDTLRVFFNEIDNAAAADAAQQLIGVECGIDVTKEPWGPLHYAVLQVQIGLRALGIPCADWTFVPMFNSFKTESKNAPETVA